MAKKDVKKDGDVENTIKSDVIQPEIIENKSDSLEIKLKKGECLIKEISSNKNFVTSVKSAEKYFNDSTKYEVVKKNQ
ncbi:hypothetical protein QP519_10440 [Weeksella virosa]|uniref:hypothetical protein n=1 Tax=Weeksella virosa TaxID=1014 RepID=UPI002556EA6A|nr:hypothetical protein [Weeksella virosa]MDK7375952.1 hypothetical protein [Weeksella virosa]